MISQQDLLSITDVEQIVRLIAHAGDPSLNLAIPDRKRILLDELAALIGADVWLWSASVPNPAVPGDVMTASLVDGGWESPEQQTLVYQALSDPQFATVVQKPIIAAALSRRYTTFMRQDILGDEQWHEIGEAWRKTGLEYLLLTVYPICDETYSAIGFHRRQSKPNFTERERSIVHVVFRQVDWLHRHGTNLPVNGQVVQLSPRERQVLVYLLAGLSKKEISLRLKISQHTVGDYMKQLHKHFAVNTRAELQALFHTGTPTLS